MLDLNGEIILELNQADYYLLINFRRGQPLDSNEYGGSLFAHREIAVRYATGLEKMLSLSKTGDRNVPKLGCP